MTSDKKDLPWRNQLDSNKQVHSRFGNSSENWGSCTGVINKGMRNDKNNFFCDKGAQDGKF